MARNPEHAKVAVDGMSLVSTKILNAENDDEVARIASYVDALGFMTHKRMAFQATFFEVPVTNPFTLYDACKRVNLNVSPIERFLLRYRPKEALEPGTYVMGLVALGTDMDFASFVSGIRKFRLRLASPKHLAAFLNIGCATLTRQEILAFDKRPSKKEGGQVKHIAYRVNRGKDSALELHIHFPDYWRKEETKILTTSRFVLVIPA